MLCSLRDMSIFVAAYEERSFTAAAQRENATQSGVSQHMRNLEHTLGVQLFLRERGGVTPTPAAASFYRNCLKVLRVHAMARTDIARFAKSDTGEVRIGLMPTITSRTLAPAMNTFIEQSPNVNLRITEGYSANLTQMVQAGELDCAIVPSGSTASGVRGRFFVRTPEVLVSRADSGIVPLTPVRLSELGPLKMVVPGATNIRRHTIESYCNANDVTIAQIVELDAMLGTLDFVAQTDWVSILPAIMMSDAGGPRALTVNPITSPEMHIDLMLIEPIRSPMSSAATRFVDLLQDEARRVSALWDKSILTPHPPLLRPSLAAHG
ncbi:LysR family transcriptional regulator [Roseicitreum antarcticum]|uniref:DNA-binding transcriptional regulator, LysR family n=2 Tax=Roseicitreum antarcticum TaxID=564137 RepID=A0A1H3AL85_9RHOB|nr:LysR family transcriptional regulator [Roseicitreum antarcticum]SDX29934.1 DNA-binding transcriptional regulator, LysR family [Roseicitreum antarcticum]